MRNVFSGLLIAGVATCFAGEALAETYSKAVQQFCRADYKKYCGEYGLETSALRLCMDRNGKKLSKSCVNALVKDGHVTKAEVNRRR